MGNLQALSLCELNTQVKTGLRDLFPGSFWIIGEICEINVNHSGHCYLELIEKKTNSDQIIARAKATIWAFTFRMLRPYFESTTGQKLAAGLKIMVQVSVEFHEIYGYALNIKDIEPNYTIGDISRNKKEIIKRLQDEGVFHLNKEIELPVVPQRIAVISSETAAGYGDFCDQLSNNQFGYCFKVKLFQAFMQGESAEQSIITALEQIFESLDQFDVIVLIRGGGSQSDLDCFNLYWLCYHITQMPIPIITGIGHERDETIADLVAHTSLKTPTAVAEFLIARIAAFDDYLQEMYNRAITIASEQLQTWKDENMKLSQNIISLVKLRLNSENLRLATFTDLSQRYLKGFFQKNHQQLGTVSIRMKSYMRHYFYDNNQRLSSTQKDLVLQFKNLLKNELKHLERLENANHLLDPSLVLKRGYTLTFRNGVLVKSAGELQAGDIITNKWHDGEASSLINETHLKKKR